MRSHTFDHRIENLESRILLNAGDLNLAFGGGDGRMRFFPPMTGGVAVNVAAQPDGKFVIGGYALQPRKNYVWLERFDAKGNVDKSFGANGVVKTLVSDDEEASFGDFARQGDGKFVVVTADKHGGFVARYTTSGKLDTTFGGGDGIVLTKSGLTKVVVLPSGKIAAANFDEVFEFNADGSVNTGFGTNGVVHIAAAISGVKQLFLRDIAAQSDNKVVLTGAVQTNVYSDENATAIIRLTSSGKADKSFNGTGLLQDDLGHFEGGWGVALQSGGNIIVAASDDDTHDWLLGTNSAGSGIPGFNGGINDFSSSYDDFVVGVSIFGKDQILLLGAVTSPETGRHDFIALGFDASGVRQFSKGIDFSWTDVGETNDVPVAAIQSADGNILIVGNSGEYDGSLPTSQIEIASLQSKSGGPSDQIPIQRVNGQATLTGTAGNDVIRIVQGEGYGIEYNGNRAWGWESKIVVTAGAGNDQIANLSDLPTVMNGGSGNDTMVGGTGADTFQGGGGTDTADYSNRTDNLNISLDNVANDGAAGEHDNVYSDVENITAGSGNDKLIGDPFNNYLKGGSGNDTLYGGAGNDTLDGGSGRDYLFGQDGNDTLLAKDGRADTLDGGNGFDAAQRDNTSTVKDSVLNIESFI